MSEDRTPDGAEPDAEENQPMNRAERRAAAKGKKAVQSKSGGKQGFAPKSGQAHTQRMWSNRRSGG